MQLKKVLADAKAEGYEMSVGPEAEFFLFKRGEENRPTLDPHDHASYFDVYPDDLAEDTRRDIEDELHEMWLRPRGLAPRGRDRPARDRLPPRRRADDGRQPDHLPLGRQARRRPQRHARDVHAEAALRRERLGHARQPVALARRQNAFFDPSDALQLSAAAYGYIAGLLEHLPALTAVCNPTVNSYKRLIPGYEAPVYIAWSPGNRSAAIRVPAKRGRSTRAELRTPDPTANPYLAFACLLPAGLDGVRRGLRPPDR